MTKRDDNDLIGPATPPGGRQSSSRQRSPSPSACLAARRSTTTSRGGGRATNNQHQWQQERATSGVRVSGCGNITINQKISFDSGISKSGGNTAVARMTARAARVGARQRQQQGIAALVVARTGVAWQQWQQRHQQQRSGWGQHGGNNSGKRGGDAATTAARTKSRETWQERATR